MKYYTNALVLSLGFMWFSTLAVAQTVLTVAAHAQPALVIDWVLFGFSALLSTMSGAAALAWRLNALINTATPPPAGASPIQSPWLFGVAHMLGSWLAGVLAFLAARTTTTWDVNAILLSVGLAAFGGARGLEIATERYLSGGKAFPKDPPA